MSRERATSENATADDPTFVGRGTRWRLALSTTLFALGCIGVLADGAAAQVVREDFYTTNGTVRAAVIRGNTLYIGGDFTLVGPPTGGGVPIDTTNQLPVNGFPKVVGAVYAVAADGSGGWYIGGYFNAVGGLPRSNLAHILPGGGVAAWDPHADDEVDAIAVSGGRVYVGGVFANVGGQARSSVAALDATTGHATSWDPGTDSYVSVIAVDAGKVYLGGGFSTVGGQPRSALAAVDASTGVTTVWNPNPQWVSGPAVKTLAINGSTVYVGGHFTTIGGQSRTNIAAIDATTGSATSWDPNPDDGDIGVGALVLSGGTVYFAGQFGHVGGQSRQNLAAVSASTGLVTAWNPNVGGGVNTIALSGSKVYAGGFFTTVGGNPRPFLAAVSASTGLVDTWTPEPDDNVYALAAGGGGVYVGGVFTTIARQPRNHIAALNATTGVLTSWNPNANGSVTALTTGGNAVYAGGDFTSIGGQTRNRIAAVDTSAGLATSWNPNANGAVRALAVNGTTVYAGGEFSTIGGQTRNRIAALSASTGNSTTWNPNANATVYGIALRAGTVYAGGDFTTIGGQARNHVAALGASTGTATSWNPDANAAVFVVAATPATVYAAGDFTALGVTARNRIAAIDTVGTVMAWNPNADGRAQAIAPAGNVVYVGGGFQNIGGASRSNIAALDATTGSAVNWDVSAADSVFALVASGATVYAGGSFTAIGAGTQHYLAAISAYCAAPATPGTVSATSANPQLSAVGDFNGDGQLDVAVAVSSGVQALRNLGGGSFASLSSISTGGIGRAVASADFNGDGVLDLVVSTTTGLYVALGQSSGGTPTGTFGAPAPCALGGAIPGGIAAADLNGDGVTDLVVALPLPNAIAVLRGQGANGVGDGTFAAAALYAVGGSPWQPVLADFDGDGVLDVAVTNGGSGTVSLLRGNGAGAVGSGTFQSATTAVVGPSPKPIVAGDFDQNGTTDLAVGCPGSVVVLLGFGDGTFEDASAYALTNAGATVLDLKVGDFDSNGRADLAAALSDGTVQYLFGNGYGTVAFGQFLAGPVVTIGGALSSLEVNAFDVAVGAATPVVTQSDVSKIVSVQGACVGGTGLTLEVTSPNGGEALPLRSPVRIEWRRGALVLGVNVEVSRDDGVHWQRVASDLTGNEFTWSAPPPATTHGRVRVVDANLFTLSDQSNGSFSVQPTAAVPMDGGSRGPWFSTGYPNPMHRTVRFDLRLATAGDVTVEVFDVAGRRVGVVANGRLAAGEHSLVWDGRIGTARAGDGVFFVRARIDGTQFVRRIVRVE